MLSLDEMIAQRLLDPTQDQLAVQGGQFATLHLRHDIMGLTDGLGNALTRIYAFNAAAILFIETKTPEIRRDPMGLKARYLDVNDAVDSALGLIALCQSQGIKASVAVGLGWCTTLPNHDWVGVNCYHARRLAEFADPDEVVVTKNVFTQVTVPVGVGMFEAKRERAHRVGYPFWVMRDYR